MLWFVIETGKINIDALVRFQTKLTYVMICYAYYICKRNYDNSGFKLSWLMLWFVIKHGTKGMEKIHMFQTKLTYVMICYIIYFIPFSNIIFVSN